MNLPLDLFTASGIMIKITIKRRLLSCQRKPFLSIKNSKMFLDSTNLTLVSKMISNLSIGLHSLKNKRRRKRLNNTKLTPKLSLKKQLKLPEKQLKKLRLLLMKKNKIISKN